MTKEEIASIVSKRTGLSKAVVLPVINALITQIIENVSQGRKVNLVGFGSFSTKHRSSREIYNIQTGEKFQVPAKFIPYFSPGKSFKDKVRQILD